MHKNLWSWSSCIFIIVIDIASSHLEIFTTMVKITVLVKIFTTGKYTTSNYPQNLPVISRIPNETRKISVVSWAPWAPCQWLVHVASGYPARCCPRRSPMDRSCQLRQLLEERAEHKSGACSRSSMGTRGRHRNMWEFTKDFAIFDMILIISSIIFIIEHIEACCKLY